MTRYGHFEIKVKARLGPNSTDDKSVRILNRVVYWTAEGIRYEPDQRHAEIIIHQLIRDCEEETCFDSGREASKCDRLDEAFTSDKDRRSIVLGLVQDSMHQHVHGESQVHLRS